VTKADERRIMPLRKDLLGFMLNHSPVLCRNATSGAGTQAHFGRRLIRVDLAVPHL
jgi:hypothetical protein